MRNNANSEEKKKKKATLPPQIFNEADYIGVRSFATNQHNSAKFYASTGYDQPGLSPKQFDRC